MLQTPFQGDHLQTDQLQAAADFRKTHLIIGRIGIRFGESIHFFQRLRELHLRRIKLIRRFSVTRG